VIRRVEKVLFLGWVFPVFLLVAGCGSEGTGNGDAGTDADAGADPGEDAAVEVDDAAFVSQEIPSRVDAGASFEIRVTMRNTGTTTWTAGPLEEYKLGSENPMDNQTWGTNRIYLQPDTEVAPGESYTFKTTLTAPPDPGAHDMQWRTVHENVAWFGQPTDNLPVEVVAACEPACQDKCCGNDGCGGTCPDDCAAGGMFCNTGTCLCEADPCENHCENGQQDCGEEGVDCGGECPACQPPEEGLVFRGKWLGMIGQDGVWRAAITCGMIYEFTWYNTNRLDMIAGHGKNLVYAWVGAGAYGVDSAVLYHEGNLSLGWDESRWTQLEQMLQNAWDRDIGVMLAFWDTTGLEGDRSQWPENPRRWDVNPWNAKIGRGGPYDLPGCGKAAFIEFHDFDVVLYQPGDSYPAGADDVTRGQWRQEEIMHRVTELVRAYPNAAIYLIWEAHDNGSHTWGNCATSGAAMRSWHAHMASLTGSLSPDTLVTTGDLGDEFEGFDFAASQVAYLHWWANLPYPVVSTGFPMWIDDQHSDLCLADCPPEVYERARTYIRDAWLQGIQLGAPYNEYRNSGVSDNIDPYLQSLRQSLDSIQTWEDEPGDELTVGLLPTP